MTNTSTDWRALCAELLEIIEGEYEGSGCCAELRLSARAALAQPEPEGLDDDEIDEEAAAVIPWLLEMACQAANADQPCAAGKLTLAAQLLGEYRPAVKPTPKIPTDNEIIGCMYKAHANISKLEPTWINRHGKELIAGVRCVLDMCSRSI